MNLQHFWPVLRRWWWLPALVALLAVTSTYAVSSRLPRVYEARARLQVTPAQVSRGTPDYNAVVGAEGLTRTYAEMVRSRTVVEAALAAAGLDQLYEDASTRIAVTALRDTQLIEVRARADDPEDASKLANALADVFVRQVRDEVGARFATTRQALSDRLDQLAASNATLTERVSALRAAPASPGRDAELAQTESELTQLQPSYTAASDSYQNVLLAEVRDHDLLATVERATAPAAPAGPNTRLNVTLAALASLVVGLLLVLVIEALDDRVSSAGRLRLAADLAQLGSLARLSRATEFAANGHPASAADATHMRELFRSVLARLHVSSKQHPPQVLLVTACGAGAGATTVAIGLAQAAAEAGRTVLIDANLRRGAADEGPSEVGFASVLADPRQSAIEVLSPSGVPRLWLLPSGPPSPDPGALVASPRIAGQLAELREVAALIVIDAPHALASSQAALLARHADVTVLVVDARRTRTAELRRAATLLRETGAHVAGAVLNQVPSGSLSAYDYTARRQARTITRLLRLNRGGKRARSMPVFDASNELQADASRAPTPQAEPAPPAVPQGRAATEIANA
ncbi:MAG TPA: Wzz/FepE/Etk N-terminal domain-containing protein [Chloroflexota bacterium]|nr:Wzz/FepE/Etk N-terminal domain-containing protein [Chloroflexota bacterium]